MKRKIFALMLVIPLILLFTVFSVSGAVSLAVSIPVSSIVIENKQDGIINLDKATYRDSLKLNVTVLPLNAANKGYSLNKELLDDFDYTADEVLEVEDDGTVKLLDKIGRVKLSYTSYDGGYTDSVILIATSSKVLSLSALAYSMDTNEHIDSTVSGKQFVMKATVYPQTAFDCEVIWTSSDESIVSVDKVSGLATPLSSGEATLSATSVNALGGTMTSSQKIVVTKRATESNITVNGKDEHTISLYHLEKTFSCLVETPNSLAVTLQSNNSYIDENSVQKQVLSNQKMRLHFSFSGINAPDDVTILIVDDTKQYQLKLEFVDEFSVLAFTADSAIEDGKSLYLETNKHKTLSAKIEPNIQNVSFEFYSEHPTIVEIEKQQSTRYCKLVTKNEVAQSTITIKVFLENIEIYSFSFNAEVKRAYTSFVFKENSVNYGLSETLSMGNKIVSNDSAKNTVYKDFDYTFDFVAINNLDEFAVDEMSDDSILLSSTNNSVAYLENTQNGLKLKILSSGYVTLSIRWSDDTFFQKSVQESINLYAVYGGVNVYSANELQSATADAKVVVLQDDIMLGADLSSYSTQAAISKLKQSVSSMPTTADDTYYIETLGKKPNINYVLEFKADVYGNGHFINADRITNYHDGSARLSDVIFNGPLNMVALPGIASVKAQDNIVFLVKENNVTLNGIELIGAADPTDLSQLDKVGTTLEVLANNTQVLNCRIKNGRNTVRFFGKSYQSDATLNKLLTQEKDTFKIESSIISQAREFLLKIGTNASLKDQNKNYDFSKVESNEFNVFAPMLTDELDSAFCPRCDENKDNTYFAENIVKTHLVLKNSVLLSSGLFAIGVECKFAGPLLAGYKIANIPLEGWTNIAGTSFAAQLSLEGDVRIYDWKNLDYIDSSTLIELSRAITDSYSALSIFNLNLGQMLLDCANQHPEYSKLILKANNKKYAHGGIAFYGGGYNYSIFDAANFSGVPLEEIVADMDLSETLSTLKLASGGEPFRFFMYKSNSEFNLQKQLSDLQSGDAISWIPFAI